MTTDQVFRQVTVDLTVVVDPIVDYTLKILLITDDADATLEDHIR